jgi:hypothetical protein
MTDRFNTLTVVLEEDTRVDDAEGLIQAIRRMRGVLSVSGNVASPESWMAEERARAELGKKILDVVYPKRKDG